MKVEAPAVQNKGQTDSYSESQKSSVQALALPQPKKVMWNVGVGGANVTAEVRRELEVLSPSVLCLPCCVVFRCLAEPQRQRKSLASRRTSPNLGSLNSVVML